MKETEQGSFDDLEDKPEDDSFDDPQGDDDDVIDYIDDDETLSPKGMDDAERRSGQRDPN